MYYSVWHISILKISLKLWAIIKVLETTQTSSQIKLLPLRLCSYTILEGCSKRFSFQAKKLNVCIKMAVGAKENGLLGAFSSFFTNISSRGPAPAYRCSVVCTLNYPVKENNYRVKICKEVPAETSSTSDQQHTLIGSNTTQSWFLLHWQLRYFLSTPEFPLRIASEIPRLWKQETWSTIRDTRGDTRGDTTTLNSAHVYSYTKTIQCI